MNQHPAGAVMAALVGVAALLLAACASHSTRKAAQTDAADNANVAATNAQLPRFRIRNWSAPNDHTLIVVADDGTRYRAEMMGPCIGLNFANRLAFVSRGGFAQVDRYSSVVLADGTRCTFRSFDQLAAPETKALDSYEKSQEATPAGEGKKEEPAKTEGENPK